MDSLFAFFEQLHRSLDSLRDKFDALKKEIKKQHDKQLAHRMGTGGGPEMPSKTKPMSANMKKLEELMSVSVGGLDPVYGDEDFNASAHASTAQPTRPYTDNDGNMVVYLNTIDDEFESFAQQNIEYDEMDMRDGFAGFDAPNETATSMEQLNENATTMGRLNENAISMDTPDECAANVNVNSAVADWSSYNPSLLRTKISPALKKRPPPKKKANEEYGASRAAVYNAEVMCTEQKHAAVMAQIEADNKRASAKHIAATANMRASARRESAVKLLEMEVLRKKLVYKRKEHKMRMSILRAELAMKKRGLEAQPENDENVIPASQLTVRSAH